MVCTKKPPHLIASAHARLQQCILRRGFCTLVLFIIFIQVSFLFKMTGMLGWQINGIKRLHTPSLYLCFPCLTAVLQRYRDGVCSLLFFHPYISSFVFLAAIVATITGGNPPKKCKTHAIDCACVSYAEKVGVTL